MLPSVQADIDLPVMLLNNNPSSNDKGAQNRCTALKTTNYISAERKSLISGIMGN